MVVNDGTSEVRLEIPSRSVYVGVVRLSMGSLARGAGLDEERVDDLKIAISEVCANAVLWSEEAAAVEPVTIAWIQSDERVVVEISHGAPPETSEDIQDDTQSFRRTLSTALLASLVDECAISSRPGGGTTTRLTLHR